VNLLQKLFLIAHKYYIEGKTQQQISDELGINRVLISRYLKQAREMGIVEIRLKGESSEINLMRQKMLELFGLDEVLIVPVSLTSKKYTSLAYSICAEKLDYLLNRAGHIGIGWGSTIETVVNYINASHKLEEAIFVPLTGGTNQLPSYFQTNNFVKKMADSYAGEARYIYAPFIFESSKEKENALALKEIRDAIELWTKLDIAITAIGCHTKKSPLFQRNVLAKKYLEALLYKEVVGDVLTHFFDANGNLVDIDVYDRLTNIPIEDFLKTKVRIGIAAGLEKVQSIIGALRGKLINILITDVETVELILKYSPRKGIGC